MTVLNRDAFLKPAALPQEIVTIPELGGEVIVQGMTARGRSVFESQFSTATGKAIPSRQRELRERLVIACCVDAAGARLFADEDVELIGSLPASIVEPLVDACQRVCGMNKASVEAMAKNSEGDQQINSPG